jgi:hypothetical protein
MRNSLSLLEAHLANISSDPAAEFTVALFFLDPVEQREARGIIGLVSNCFTYFELRGNNLQARGIRIKQQPPRILGREQRSTEKDARGLPPSRCPTKAGLTLTSSQRSSEQIRQTR